MDTRMGIMKVVVTLLTLLTVPTSGTTTVAVNDSSTTASSTIQATSALIGPNSTSTAIVTSSTLSLTSSTTSQAPPTIPTSTTASQPPLTTPASVSSTQQTLPSSTLTSSSSLHISSADPIFVATSALTTKQILTTSGSVTTAPPIATIQVSPDSTTRKLVTDADHAQATEKTSQCDVIESGFGKYGLPVSAAMTVLCVALLIILIVLLARRPSSKTHDDEEKNVPKLKMLEIKDADNRRATAVHDDLHTYSLDYEKHVQEKIEEHKRSASIKEGKSPSSSKPGVSTFKITKKPSLTAKDSIRSNSSASTSGPMSPVSPTAAELKPLLNSPVDEDAVVFNYNAKRPSQLLTARRTSNFDGADRRKSNASGKDKGPDADTMLDV